jgi:GNAT superfamily N-acetyltransferase
MNIRVATLQDSDEIRAVGVAAWHDTYSGMVPDSYISWALAKWWSPEAIAEIDQHTVGIAHVQIRPDQSAILWRLYIARAYRGQGIGSALIAEIERQLPSDIHTLYVEYYEQNYRASAFYARQGFEFAYSMIETFQDNLIVSVFVKRAIRA